MIKFVATGDNTNGDTIRFELWCDDGVESPIDISEHAYEIIWKARLSVDAGMDLWEIWVIVERNDRILYDYGGYHMFPYRDQISYRRNTDGIDNVERIQFIHWQGMLNSRWNTGKIYFDGDQFIAYNDRYGDDNSSDGNLVGFFKEAEATEHYKEWGVLRSGRPGIWVLARDKGHSEEFWLDYFKILQVDEVVTEGFYTSKILDSGEIRNWARYHIFVEGSGSYDIHFGTGDGVFLDNISEVPDSITLQFRITMRAVTVIDSVEIVRNN